MERKAVVERTTKETEIYVELNLDANQDKSKIILETHIPLFEHFLANFIEHSQFYVLIKAKGDIQHHLLEDLGICMGKAFKKAIGDGKGIRRFGHVFIPMDDTLMQVVVDIGGRPYLNYNINFSQTTLEGLNLDLIKEFWTAFVNHAFINLYIKQIDGLNCHHIAESIFKATGLVLNIATQIQNNKIPSTKGILD